MAYRGQTIPLGLIKPVMDFGQSLPYPTGAPDPMMAARDWATREGQRRTELVRKRYGTADYLAPRPAPYREQRQFGAGHYAGGRAATGQDPFTPWGRAINSSLQPYAAALAQEPKGGGLLGTLLTALLSAAAPAAGGIAGLMQSFSAGNPAGAALGAIPGPRRIMAGMTG